MRISYNIATTLVDQAQKHPFQKAVIEPVLARFQSRPAYRHLTYSELNQESDQLAIALMQNGITKSCRVALMVPPSLDFFVLTFALFKAGAIPVFIDPGLGIKRMKRCLDEADTEVFIGSLKAHLARVLFRWRQGQWKQLFTVGPYGIGGPTVSLLKKRFGHSKTHNPLPSILPEDPAAILFTSGSTGSPKGALYSHRNFHAQIESLRKIYDIHQGEIDLCTFPLFALFAPALGMTAVIPDMNFTRPGQVNPDRIFQAIDHFGVHNLFGSPALMRRVGDAAKKRGLRFPSLKRVVSAGAPVPATVIASFCESLNAGAKFHTPYGATEALPIASIASDEVLDETSLQTNRGAGICVGRPVEGVDAKIIQITDDPILKWSDELMLPQGQIGEIIVRGAQVTRCYFNQATATTATKIPIQGSSDFYHRMGDVGYFDDQGRLWYCGRKTHRVQTPAGTLFTIPCEGIFNTHKDVFRTALVGVGTAPNQSPVICIETDPNRKFSQREQAELVDQLKKLGALFPETRDVQKFLFHHSFPVDIRHNSKIFRERLAVWAEEALR